MSTYKIYELYVRSKKWFQINCFQLKMIAIITMLIDHVGAVLFPEYRILRIIGRLSFPIFCFLVVNGFFYTKSRLKYALRLLVFACVSEVPFNLAFHNQVVYAKSQNVFFTLLLALLMIWTIEFIRTKIFRDIRIFQICFEAIIVFITCYIANILYVDYTYYGIIMIYWFYLLQYNKIMLCFFQAYTNIGLMGQTQSYATFALIPILMYNREKGKNTNKYIFYLFYPIHLLILYDISYFMY